MVDRKVNKNKGFTLIELLVVISIIGVLASVILSSLNSARAQARDATIYSDLRQVQLALEMYYHDHGHYPITTGSPPWRTVCTTGADPTARGVSGPNGYIPDLAPEYIGVLPVNPTGCVGGLYDGYIYQSNGTDYKFAADWSAEIGNECKLGERFSDPPRTTTTNHRFCSVYTPGASNW